MPWMTKAITSIEFMRQAGFSWLGKAKVVAAGLLSLYGLPLSSRDRAFIDYAA